MYRRVASALPAAFLCVLCAACGGGSSTPPPWPTAPPETSALAPLRGLRYTRGIIHAHSVYSHDACDGDPWPDGAPNAECLAELRAGMCQAHEDWFMLTDHQDSMAQEDDWSKLLLHDAAAGDELVTRDGAPIANLVACPDRAPVLLMAGHEDSLMPIGMEGHYPGDAAARDAFYGRRDADAVTVYRDTLGAVVLQNHTEEHTVDDLAALGLDGVEVFNAHAALLPGSRKDQLHVDPSAAIAGTAPFFEIDPGRWDEAPEPDLSLLGFLEDFVVYNELWDGLLARGRMLGVLGTDVHRNTFTGTLRDGERGDSYRRMMRWYSNWVLMPGGEITPDGLKDALRAGRLVGVFEVIGTPDGFDFHAEAGGQVYEMGDEVALADGPTLIAVSPTVHGLGADQPAPEITLHLVCAGAEVATAADRIEYAPSAAGACRVDVTIVPRHLEPYLGTQAQLAGKNFPWLKANAIYVE